MKRYVLPYICVYICKHLYIYGNTYLFVSLKYLWLFKAKMIMSIDVTYKTIRHKGLKGSGK